MSLQPIVIRRYYNTRSNRFVSPGLSLAKCTTFDTIPLGSYFVLQIHACIGYAFDLDSSGNVPSANQDTAVFVGAIGTPTFGVKTRTAALAGSNTFAGVVNGFASAYTSLANGRVGIAGVFPQTVTPNLDYLAQVLLRDGSGNAIAAPAEWLPIYLTIPVVTGSESGNPSVVNYNGVATIPEGATYVDVTVTGLTTGGTLATLTQQDNGTGLSTFWGTCSTNSLRINSGGTAPAGGYKVYWQLASL